jgi:hypothetical protein|tara:strand:+ start:736 stop:915 length:180 start_codon:yes stop_codon:yes gene_type:complete
MTQELRNFLDTFRLRMLEESRRDLSYGEDKKIVEQCAMYLWKKSRADMKVRMESVLEND